MSERARRSTTSSFRPTLCSRSCCAGCATRSACGIWRRCFCCAGSNSPMKPYGSGRNVLLRCWPGTSVASARGNRVDAGMSTKTYVKIKGKWAYLYRAMDRQGNLVDSMLSATRDMTAAQRFFRSSLSVINQLPKQVTTDGHDSWPRAIREVLGPQVHRRCSAYLNRRIEQDHRGVKQRYYPMLGFGEFGSARRFGRAFEGVRQYFRPRRIQNQVISLAQGRRQFLFRALELESLFVAA